MIQGLRKEVFHWEQRLSDEAEFTNGAYVVGNKVRFLFEKHLIADHQSLWIYEWWFTRQQFTRLIEDLIIWALNIPDAPPA